MLSWSLHSSILASYSKNVTRSNYSNFYIVLGSKDGPPKIWEDARRNTNAIGKSDRSALSFAAKTSHLEVFDRLYQHKDCQSQTPDEKEWTPLFWAIERDHTTI